MEKFDLPPNFLVFITDQQRADHLGCYGNGVVKTPHIDALADRGSRFERFYVANPVCMPNRGSIMTSRMPSLHGSRSNGIPLPLDSVTFADVLGDAGYATALVGKCHLQNIEDQPPMLEKPRHPGLQGRPGLPEARKPAHGPASYLQEMRTSWNDPEHRIAVPYYGFQDIDLCNHHGDECFGDWLRWLQAHSPELASRIGREHGKRDSKLIAPQAWKTLLDEFNYPTHYIATRSAEWIRQHVAARPMQPFALVCSFPDPHHPWTPPGKYWDMYSVADIQLSRKQQAHIDPPPHLRWLMQERASGQANTETQRVFAASEREIKEITALTYGMITNIDDRVGLVMDALRESGADQTTVVIFTSDHGDFMGDHGLMLKGPLHYEGLVRVPFIWSDPAAQDGARVRRDLGSSIDIGASVLARAGIAPPNGVQGKALFAPSGQGIESGRDAVLIEDNQQRTFMGFSKPVWLRTLVTDTHRISVYGQGDRGELYDLAADPDEMVNLWDVPSAVQAKAELLGRLARSMIEHGETSPHPTHVA